MPDSRTHKLVGLTAGAGYAAYQAKEQTGLSFLLEVIGGSVGGFAGGQLPDILEPALSSWHRSTAHSCAAGTGIIAFRNKLMTWESFCREQAANCNAVQMGLNIPEQVFVPVPLDPLSKLQWTLAELFWQFLAGFTNGLAAGYVSHLALDAFVGSRSIPLLTSGF